MLLGLSALNVASNDSEEIIHRVQELIHQGNLDEARSRLTEGLKSFPKEAGLYDLLGVIDAQQGHYQAAEANFRRAIKESPHLKGAYLNLGHLYQENAAKHPQARRKAVEIYQELLALHPGDVEGNYQLAFLLEIQGSFQASLLRLAHLPPPDQERAQALSVRLADYVGLGENLQAGKVADRLLASPELAESDVISILPILEAHRFDRVELRLLEGLANRRIASAPSLFRLALVYERQEQWDRARQILEDVYQEQPNTVPPLVELARVAFQQHDNRGALGYLAHARHLEPRNSSIHFFFGIVCVEENLAQEAYNSFKKAVELAPDNPDYNYALGSIAVERQDPREALPYFEKYCAFRPQDPRGWLALGTAYFYARDYDNARKKLESVARFPQTAAAAHYYLGRMANQEGKFDEAVRELRRALQVNPKLANAYAELGLVYMKQKENVEADKSLQRALELDPDNYTANLNLMILFERTKDPRAGAQTKKFEEVKKKRAEKAKELLRAIELRP